MTEAYAGSEQIAVRTGLGTSNIVWVAPEDVDKLIVQLQAAKRAVISSFRATAHELNTRADKIEEGTNV